MTPTISLRPLTPSDEPFLWEMLYQALYVPPGLPPLPRDLLYTAELRRYVEGWGRESDSGWLFPVGDEVSELGYVAMFDDMFNAIDEGRAPSETFYDGYVVNAVMDACYRSVRPGRWEPVELDWRGGRVDRIKRAARTHGGKTVIKEETMPDGRRKLILKDEASGEFVDVVA